VLSKSILEVKPASLRHTPFQYEFILCT
jgi:hypothetical protein